jgi:translation elongation factor EF-G
MEKKTKFFKSSKFFFFLDQVDRIILDKPHFINQQQLNLMKHLPANRTLMNIKYSSNENSSIIKDAIDVDDDQKFLKYELNYKKNLSERKSNDNISEIDLENEVFRLQNVLKNMTEEFSMKRKQLEDDCCEQLKKLNENADQTHRLQQDLEQGKHRLEMIFIFIFLLF